MQITLRRVGGQARGWSRSLGHYHYHRHLCHAGQAEPLGHEAKSAARCPDGRFNPGIGESLRHEHHGDLAFRMNHLEADLWAIFCHEI